MEETYSRAGLILSGLHNGVYHTTVSDLLRVGCNFWSHLSFLTFIIDLCIK